MLTHKVKVLSRLTLIFNHNNRHSFPLNGINGRLKPGIHSRKSLADRLWLYWISCWGIGQLCHLPVDTWGATSNMTFHTHTHGLRAFWWQQSLRVDWKHRSSKPKGKHVTNGSWSQRGTRLIAFLFLLIWKCQPAWREPSHCVGW